jgi:hypothetical protein
MVTQQVYQAEFLPNAAETYDANVNHRKGDCYGAWAWFRRSRHRLRIK